MPRPEPRNSSHCRRALFALPLLSLSAGCGLIFNGKPSAANIELRKQNQALREQVRSLREQHEGDRDALHAARDRSPGLTTLSADRLDRLFTVHGLKFGRLTGSADLDPAQPGDQGLKLYVVPTDESGQAIKAAGAFTVEAFDLAKPEAPRIGLWSFDLNQARALWNDSFMDYTYVLPLRWQTPPQHADLTLKVAFTDELTGGTFRAQREITIKLPPTRPTTTPASAPVPHDEPRL